MTISAWIRKILEIEYEKNEKIIKIFLPYVIVFIFIFFLIFVILLFGPIDYEDYIAENILPEIGNMHFNIYCIY